MDWGASRIGAGLAPGRAPSAKSRGIEGPCARPKRVMASAPAASRQTVKDEAKASARPLLDTKTPSAEEAAAAMPPLEIGMVTPRLTTFIGPTRPSQLTWLRLTPTPSASIRCRYGRPSPPCRAAHAGGGGSV